MDTDTDALGRRLIPAFRDYQLEIIYELTSKFRDACKDKINFLLVSTAKGQSRQNQLDAFDMRIQVSMRALKSALHDTV